MDDSDRNWQFVWTKKRHVLMMMFIFAYGIVMKAYMVFLCDIHFMIIRINDDKLLSSLRSTICVISSWPSGKGPVIKVLTQAYQCKSHTIQC